MGLNWFCETWFLSSQVLGPGRGLCFTASVSLGDKQQQQHKASHQAAFIFGYRALASLGIGFLIPGQSGSPKSRSRKCHQISLDVLKVPPQPAFFLLVVLAFRNDQTERPRRPSGKTTADVSLHLNASRRRQIAYVHVAEGAEDVAFVSRYVLEETNKQEVRQRRRQRGGRGGRRVRKRRVCNDAQREVCSFFGAEPS